MKRMKHPNHGFHNALDDHEEARMRLNGWVDDAPAEVDEEVTDQDAELNNVIAASAKRAYVRKVK